MLTDEAWFKIILRQIMHEGGNVFPHYSYFHNSSYYYRTEDDCFHANFSVNFSMKTQIGYIIDQLRQHGYTVNVWKLKDKGIKTLQATRWDRPKRNPFGRE